MSKVQAKPMLEVTEIESLGDWSLHRERFDALAGSYFTCRFSWLSAAWLHCSRPGDRLSVLSVSRGGEPIAYLPLFGREHTLHGRCLQLVGSGKPCSDRMGIFVAPEDCGAACDALADHLRNQGEAGAWDWLELDGVQIRDPRMQRFLASLRRVFGQGLYEQRQLNCWEITLPNSWEAYLMQCGKNSRHEYRKLGRDYFETGRVVPKIAASKGESLSQLAEITKLHQRRRHSIDSSGCLDSEGFERFLENAATNLVEEKTWFSMLIEVDGSIAGGVVGAIDPAERLSLYLVGMEPELSAHRPGTLTNLAAVRYAIDSNCKILDFMRGDEEYKRRMGGQAIGQYVWRAAAPRVLPRLRGSVFQAGSAVKRWLKPEPVAT